MTTRPLSLRRGVRDIVPSGVRVADSAALVGVDTLHALEGPYVAKAVDRRRREFATGRHCARRAMAELEPGMNLHRAPILVGAHRQPTWPGGIVGSITHCRGYCAAAVARIDQFVAIGIDAEVNAPLPDEVVNATCLAVELESLPSIGGVHWPSVLFSAREALYKAWYPIVGTWLDYHAVEVLLDASCGVFGVRFLDSVPRCEQVRFRGLRGAFTWNDTHVWTAVWLSRDVCTE